METFDRPVPDAEIEALIGDPIKSGTRREVFRVKDDSGAVVKRMKDAIPFPGSNFLEFNIWNFARGNELRNVFGEVFGISESGKYLVMEYLADVPSDDDDFADAPDIPEWLTDLKSDAFGRNHHGQIKVRDYDTIKTDMVIADAKLVRSTPKANAIVKRIRSQASNRQSPA